MASNDGSGKQNPLLPSSYQPVMNQDNFDAPAHNLSTRQQEQIAEVVEGSAGHLHNTGNSSGSTGGFGSGSLNDTSNSSSLADTLGSGTGQQRHLGQYELTENQLDDPRERIGRDSEFGNTGRSGGLSGTGDGTRQAAGTGAGSGLAATAAAQGLGSTGQERSIEDQRLGGLIGDDPSLSSSSRSGAGLGAGAGAAGLAGAGAYGASSGRTGHGSTMREAMDDASGNRSGAGGLGAGAGAAAVGTAGASGLGASSTSGHGAGAGEKGMLAQPQHETGLTNELERRAQKSGTHAAGFGTHGNE